MNGFFRTRLLTLGAAIGFLCWPAFAFAYSEIPADKLKTNQFDIEYVEPKNPAHRPIYEMIKEQRILEKFQAFLAPIKLPIRITLKVEGCDGVANATFWDDAIKVCYEYFEYVWNQTPKMATQGLSPKDAMIGPTVDVFLHEAGHAVLEVLDIPFFGREEEAADYFATYLLLQFCKDDARRLILGASFISGREAMDDQGKAPELRLLADTHSLPAQRHFNRWCMAYGADPVLFADAISFGMLPKSRAKHCRYEYQTNEYAFRKLISPYIDEEMKQKVLARKWFQFETPVAATLMDMPTETATIAPEDSPKAFRPFGDRTAPKESPTAAPEGAPKAMRPSGQKGR